VLQAAPEAEVDADHAEILRSYASRLTPEDVQLFYQIGLHGRRDIALAPDARSGLEMTLLRMLAFRPTALTSAEQAVGNAAPARPAVTGATAAKSAARNAPVSEATVRPALTPAVKTVPISVAADNDAWSETVAKLGLSGLVRELANHCVLDARDGDQLRLTLDQTSAHLLNKEREAVFTQALSAHYGRPISVRITPGSPQVETPARERQRNQTERQQAAVEVIMNDPNVQVLQENFSAKVDAGSIRPKT
jgi:DNA polymerase III subunit gamma/tau